MNAPKVTAEQIAEWRKVVEAQIELAANMACFGDVESLSRITTNVQLLMADLKYAIVYNNPDGLQEYVPWSNK